MMKKLILLLLLPLLIVSAKEKVEKASQPATAALQSGKTAAVRQTPLVNKFTAPRMAKAAISPEKMQENEKAMQADMESLRLVLDKVQAGNRMNTSAARQTLTALPQTRNLRTMINAQQRATGASILWNKNNGTPAFVTFPQKVVLKKSKIDQETLKNKALSYLKENASWMYLQNPQSELELIDARTDELGASHFRFQQKYQGYPVWGADLYLHYGTDGVLTTMNGRWQPTPEGMPLVYALSREQAIARAAAYLGIEAKIARIWQAEQVIYIDDRGKATSAWHIELGATMYDDMRVFIDGRDGAVLHAYNNIQTGTPAKGTGVDLFGQTRALDIYKVDNDYYLLNTTKSMFDGNTSNSITDMQGIILIGDARNVEPDAFNYYYYINSTTPNSWPANTVSLSYAFSRVYDYYKTVHGLITLDGQRHNIIGVENIGSNYNNAFWSGGIKMFCFGNGDGQVFSDLAGSFDVIAHEYGHGVTQYHSNLEYQFQSGALNEAYSDFSGVMAEFFADPANADWLIGEDCIPASSSSTCLRDLANPHNPSSLTSDYPMKMSEYADWTIDDDNGGVHRNSTIPGHAFYVLSTLMARDKVEKIIYRAYIEYMTRGSQFVDLRLAAIQAAKDLYPNDGSAALVGQAFDQVEVYNGSETEPDPPYEPVSGNDYVLALIDPSGEMVQIKSDVPFQNGAATSFGVNSISKPSVTDDGSTIVYVDKNNNINLYDAVAKSNQLITNNGYYANVAISPHADFLAYTPKYEILPSTIGILDLTTQKSVTRKLSIPTTTQGAEIVANYADILDWSIEGGYLIFDCTFTLRDGSGNDIDTWGIYLTNAADDAFIPIFQADTQFAVGNPSFSSTRDNVIAFDVLDYSSGADTPEYYLYAFDLFSGELGLLHQNINIYGHPSFSPDDHKIVFQEKTDDDVSFLSQATMQADGLNADQNSVQPWVNPVHFPVWYAVGTRPQETNTLFEEQFDGDTFPPAGWLAPDQSTHPDYGWDNGNITDHDFSAIQPGSVASATCGYNPNAQQVDRLFSPIVSLSGSNPVLTFWAGYNYYWTSNYEVNVYLTKPGSLEPDQVVWRIKVEGNDGGEEWTWHECTVDLGSVAGRQNVRLLWEYRGLDGDMFALDGVQLVIRSGGQAVESPKDISHSGFTLVRNYPNPFNDETTLAYQLQHSGEVTLQIFNINGELIETLMNREVHSAGTFTKHWNAAGVSSGIYFYRLTTPDGVAMGKAIMMK
jgi:bacillolysin